MHDLELTHVPENSAAGFQSLEAKRAGVHLLPVSAGVVSLLRKIGNPVANGKLEGDKIVFTTEEAMELVFALCTPPADQRQLLAKGREVYAEAAAELADRFSIGVFQEMNQQAVAHFVAAIVRRGKPSTPTLTGTLD